MMAYWQGYMNWPLDKEWICETCGEYAGLTWGMVHATCRCNQCHTQYRMRDKEDAVVAIPICHLRDEYRQPAKTAWEMFGVAIAKLTDAQWDKAGAPQ